MKPALEYRTTSSLVIGLEKLLENIPQYKEHMKLSRYLIENWDRHIAELERRGLYDMAASYRYRREANIL